MAISRVAVLPTRQNSNWQHMKTRMTGPNQMKFKGLVQLPTDIALLKFLSNALLPNLRKLIILLFSKYPVTFERVSRLKRNLAQLYISLGCVGSFTINYWQWCQIYKRRF